LTLQEEIDMEVQQYILYLRKISGSVNGAVVRASIKGIRKRKNKEASGNKEGAALTMPVLNKDWSRYLLERMQFVKHKANTKAKLSVENFSQLKHNFLSDISGIVNIEEIPTYLIINWDHTALKYVPVGSWTMARKGSERYQLLLWMINIK